MTARMTFSGDSLERVHFALQLAQAEIHNQIATCPDAHHYEEDLDELEIEKAKFQRMERRVARKLGYIQEETT